MNISEWSDAKWESIMKAEETPVERIRRSHITSGISGAVRDRLADIITYAL